MKKIVKTVTEREAIVAEYLLGELSYRSLGKKHGVDYRVVHSWVKKFRGTSVQKSKKTNQKLVSKEPLPTDVKTLQEELRKAKLHNELLNAIIDIAEDQLKINIRKKSGTKQ